MPDVSQVSGRRGLEAMLPPPSRADSEVRSSPSRPPIPPIPGTSSPLKQPKRGDRRKSAVQGAKVDKRSATGVSSPAKPHARTKSRNVTRKPTTSVQKLVDKARKTDDRQAAGRPEAAGVGKVAAAVEKIEKQVRRQEEDNNKKKQKDGTPVRRSQRSNKGVRLSMG